MYHLALLGGDFSSADIKCTEWALAALFLSTPLLSLNLLFLTQITCTFLVVFKLKTRIQVCQLAVYGNLSLAKSQVNAEYRSELPSNTSCTQHAVNQVVFGWSQYAFGGLTERRAVVSTLWHLKVYNSNACPLFQLCNITYYCCCVCNYNVHINVDSQSTSCMYNIHV